LYLEASPQERARRRMLELEGRGEEANYQEILQAMEKRDEIDKTRAVAPLRPAEDAIFLDSDNLNIEQVLTRVLAMIKEGG